MAENTPTLGQRLTDNPILAAARANSTPAPESTAPMIETLTPVLTGKVVPGSKTPLFTVNAPVPSPTPSATPVTPVTPSQSASFAASAKAAAPVREEDRTTDDFLTSITEGIEEGKVFAVKRANELVAAGRKEATAGDLAVGIAKNIAVIQKQKDLSTMQAEQQTKDIINAGGGIEGFKSMSLRKNEARNNMIATQAAVSASVNDDTLTGKIKNFFSIGGLVEEANVAEATFNKIDRAQDEFTEFASDTVQNVANLQTTVTWGTLKAEQDRIVQLGQQQSALYGVKADQFNADATLAIMGANKDEIQSQQSKWQMLQQEKVFKATQADRRRIADKAKQDRVIMNTLIDGVQAGWVVIGQPSYIGQDPTLIQQQRDQIEARISLGGENLNEMVSMFELGIGRVKPTAAEAHAGLSLANASSMVDGSNPYTALLAQAQADIEEDAKLLNAVPLDKNTQPSLFNAKAAAIYADKEREILPGDTTNPNRADPLSEVVKWESVKNEPLVVNVIGSLFNERTQDFSPSQLVQQAFAAVKTKDNKEGSISFEEAVQGVVAMYRAAASVNTTHQNRINLGGKAQTTYNVRIQGLTPLAGFVSGARFEGAGAFSGVGTIIDLMDETQVRLLGVRTLVGRVTPNLIEARGLSPTIADETGLPPQKAETSLLDFLAPTPKAGKR